MKYFKRTLSVACITAMMIGAKPAYSQLATDLELITHFNPPGRVQKHSAVEHNLSIPSNPKEIITLSIDFYQYFISSQDVPSCLFTPSCSHFSELAFERFGILKGILLTSDRLQRCHTLSDKDKWYIFNYVVGRYEDPVEQYGERK